MGACNKACAALPKRMPATPRLQKAAIAPRRIGSRVGAIVMSSHGGKTRVVGPPQRVHAAAAQRGRAQTGVPLPAPRTMRSTGADNFPPVGERKRTRPLRSGVAASTLPIFENASPSRMWTLRAARRVARARWSARSPTPAPATATWLPGRTRRRKARPRALPAAPRQAARWAAMVWRCSGPAGGQGSIKASC